MPKVLPAIKVSRLSKRFEKTKALTKISFEIKPGKIVALIGPNGSGKTTLIKCLVGLHTPTKGSAEIFGNDIQVSPLEAKKLFGYVPDNPTGFDYLSGYELLKLTASLKGLRKKDFESQAKELIGLFKLEKLIDAPLETYSRGTKQKVAFLCALLGDPKLLIIDEPIVGLDPDSIEIFGQILKDFAQKQGTVLFSTHILEFGKRFANQVLLMNNGRIKTDKPITNKTSLNKEYQKSTRRNN